MAMQYAVVHQGHAVARAKTREAAHRTSRRSVHVEAVNLAVVKLLEPWQETQQRLSALVDASDAPTEADVLAALAPIDLSSDFLVGHEAFRLLSLLNVPDSKKRAITASASLIGSAPPGYSAHRIVMAVRALIAEKRTYSKKKRIEKQLLVGADQDRHVTFARSAERQAIEVARANEALAKRGHVPMWVARLKRSDEQKATRERVQAERDYMAGKRIPQ
jgi:hypothetical protein